MAELAINGGKRVVDRELGRAWPERDEREVNALREVVESGIWWRGGFTDRDQSKVVQFEDAWAKYQSAKHCVAVTNGTQAIECALKALGIEAGDEVLVPGLTFVASATAIALVNGVPIFCDVDPNTVDISVESMEANLTPRTKAAVVVHNGGYPCDMDRIMAFARKHGIAVIEDCAHAHGTQWNGRGAGSIGDFGTWSFQMGKVLTCGEGGAITACDDELAAKAYSYHHIGRISGRPFYEFHRVASNLRMTEWQGAILLTQLERLDEQLATRERNTKYLAAELAKIPGLRPIARDPRVTRWGFYYWNFFYDQEAFDGVHRDVFLKAITAEGVPVGVGGHGMPIYRNPLFEDIAFGRTDRRLWGEGVDYHQVDCPNCEDLFRNKVMSISHRAFLGELEDMDLMLEAMRKVRANVDELKAVSV